MTTIFLPTGKIIYLLLHSSLKIYIDLTDERENGEKNKDSSDTDELYSEALEIIKSERKASTSFLQRKLQIGYNRAARIIDQMEANGEVSKANHVGKREVLK